MSLVKTRRHVTPFKQNVVGYLQQRQYQSTPFLSSLVRSRLAAAKSLYHKDLVGHFGCVNAIEFAHGVDGNPCWIVSGGDDRRVLTWDICESQFKEPDPVCMIGQHNSNIFCLSFDMSNTKIFSGGNDEQVIYHDFPTGKTLDVFAHEDVVYGLSVDPNNINVFASAADDGKVRIYDVREPATSGNDPFCLADCGSSMHAVMYNPAEPRLILTANNAHGVGLWDIRRPKKYLMRYGSDFGEKQQHNCMSVRVNSLGTQLLALYRRLPLMLYDIDRATPVAKFTSVSSNHSTNYSNSCTMKSCSFAGDKDQYVLSGSDSFNVFMWEVPDTHYLSQKNSQVIVDSPKMLLQSHRSIVNQVRYCKSNHLLASSGVEKVIKIWSTFPVPGGEGDLLSESKPSKPERLRFTQEQYLSIMLRQEMMHDYSNGDVDEDPHMMAFFDSLIQAGGDMWSSDDDSVEFVGPQQQSAFHLYSQSSSDSTDSENEIVAQLLSDVSSETNENSIQESLTLSDPSGTLLNISQDDQCRSESSSSSSESQTGSASQAGSASLSATVSQTVPDAPYRAKAKRMVKRMRLLRQRVENSDTSDSEDFEVSPGNRVQASTSHTVGTSSLGRTAVCNSTTSVIKESSSLNQECVSPNGNSVSICDKSVCPIVTNNNLTPQIVTDSEITPQSVNNDNVTPLSVTDSEVTLKSVKNNNMILQSVTNSKVTPQNVKNNNVTSRTVTNVNAIHHSVMNDSVIPQTIKKDNVTHKSVLELDTQDQKLMMSGTNHLSKTNCVHLRETQKGKLTNNSLECKKTVGNSTLAYCNVGNVEKTNTNTSCLASTSSNCFSEYDSKDYVENENSHDAFDSSKNVPSCEFKRRKKQTNRRQYRRSSNHQLCLDDEDVL